MHRKSSRPVRATPAEIAAYAAQVPAPLYPLTHWVMAGGHRCPVEGLFEGDGNPNYEIMFPAGMHDDGYGTHSFLCDNLKDVEERAECASFIPCTEECD
jgi:hypothetical protein